ncbi:hypothetical protein [Rathayibacter rathayi]|uniref:Zeta toxin domain-containing protein n=1 Tax=Rathayibacter rathayi TaxID=33887 RepID=A0ABX5AF02_RATRA|nr:hypothetical protein [Rathayibacter rathayi]PPF24295.1 hypothetical protein C5C34_06090 [Rathayibacter rathayi]PPF51616.1 hypothetical protein C5C08_02080 [Rathayibacter rathayi]PPF83207.1 hypothetical protein C5C14_02120 [Rathayibacter rathayi]PPG47037.1 hypothetical protein C5C20_02075 [Rathayibacter rathayi]PPG96502.1 hypothetical protein C5C22_02450 [Rathayibacter rathayi]
MTVTSPPPLVGLGGALRSGNDTFADHLVAEHNFVKIGMSDPLRLAPLTLDQLIPGETSAPRTIVETLLRRRTRTGRDHIRYSELHANPGYTDAKRNPEVRGLLQRMGDDVGRTLLDENVRVNIAERTIREHHANGKNVVITALRYPNKVELLERLGGDSYRIARGAVDSGLRSERSVTATRFSRVIRNDGTVAALHQRADYAIADLRGTFKLISPLR